MGEGVVGLGGITLDRIAVYLRAILVIFFAKDRLTNLNFFYFICIDLVKFCKCLAVKGNWRRLQNRPVVRPLGGGSESRHRLLKSIKRIEPFTLTLSLRKPKHSS